jgi:hypothetical protein
MRRLAEVVYAWLGIQEVTTVIRIRQSRGGLSLAVAGFGESRGLSDAMYLYSAVSADNGAAGRCLGIAKSGFGILH